VLHHQESTERQYALREKAEELGWGGRSGQTQSLALPENWLNLNPQLDHWWLLASHQCGGSSTSIASC
jgi:hypothetical protein